MIRTLVVDDDYRVAKLHSAAVDRVEGFTTVGEAHTAGEARTMIAELHPDLMILDIYLPDEDGLSLLRSLTAEDPDAPDCMIVTAARDLDSVRAAIGLGAVYYLVKPFGFRLLREQLETYRRWRQEMTTAGNVDADQSVVDALYAMRQPAGTERGGRPRLPPTMARILAIVLNSQETQSASSVADQLGISRPTAQRYLTELERKGLIALDLEYGATGRPVHRYARPSAPEL
ncbi:response regulator [Jatrophihabitans telluris]|uniref:Transcriptional regulatory protein n=1 Tax=Jatrophihabitans telluris TaxID=2038343 RepID=A0ABY4QZT6_9ACTN|nr:response regulator [Jatrophihabitans telluris]UQX89033.1 response regulator [Jatrophihabitans telluris]